MTESHDVPCGQVMAALWQFIDREAAALDRLEMMRHLETCTPCAQESAVETALKALIARTFCAEPAPERLRARVTAQITRIEVQISRFQPPAG
jgi:mycothiol system anti-sigma-R factor